MKDFIQILKRFIPPYKRALVLSIFYNIISALFSGIAMLFMIPILEVLFQTAKEVDVLLPWQMTKDVLANNLYYYVTLVKLKYGVVLVMPFIGLFMLVATLIKVGSMYMADHEMVGIRNGVVKDLRTQIFNKLMRLPMAYFSDERKGDLISRATGDVTEVEGSIMASINMLFKNPIMIIVSVGFLFAISYQLTIFVFIMLPIAGWIIGKTGKTLKHKSKESRTKLGDLLGIVEEALGGLRIIKAFNAEPKMERWYGDETEQYRTIMNKLQRRYALAHPVSEFLGTIVMVFIVWFGAIIINGEGSTLDGASFIAYIGVFYQIINPAKQFSTGYFNVQKGLAAMERIDTILLAENKITDKATAIDKKGFETAVEYKNVTFAYKDKKVLKNVSVSIPKGKMVALVGQSGSGKTTFVDLMPRFYDIQEGSIEIDGTDIRDMKVFDVRELMGNVNQEAILFNDSFFNNIAFGVEDATLEQVEKAAKVANAHEFIMATENGYDSVVGDRGGNLSGGQRQRISIARAVLKNPDILILDEATSALDTESEKLVQEALENLMNSRTSVVIAHRLSTVRNADMICVFDDGEIVERGTHDELKAKGGVYSKLHDLQVR